MIDNISLCVQYSFQLEEEEEEEEEDKFEISVSVTNPEKIGMVYSFLLNNVMY